MIRWKELEHEYAPRYRRLWRRSYCSRFCKDGACMGVSRRIDDDEPNEICTVCDEFAGAGKDES